jgi:hypothetical protein
MTLDYARRSQTVVHRISCVLPIFICFLCAAMMAASFLWGRSKWHLYAWQGNLVQRGIDEVLGRGIHCCSWLLVIPAGLLIQAGLRRDLRGGLVVAILLIGSAVMLACAVGVVSQAYE